MRKVYFSFIIFAAIVAIIYTAEDVSATAQCQPTMPTASTCQGISGVGTTTGGVASGRCFYFTTDSTAPACSTGGIITTGNMPWELNAGACITLYYWDIPNGVTPPAAPNKLTLLASFDDTATIIKTYLSATAPPISGTTYQFCATSDGNAGSPARAGTVFLFLQAVKDNGNGLPGNTNYDVRANGVGTQDTSNDAGFLRANTFVSSISSSAPVSGSVHAYGTTTDELITVTSTFTPPFADANKETSRNSIVDELTFSIGENAATLDFDGTGSFSQQFTVDSSFPFTGNPYIAGWSIQGNAVHGLRGTILTASGHGAGLIRLSDTVIYNPSDVTIDSRIIHDSDGLGTFATADNEWVNKLINSGGTIVTKYNKGEDAYTEGYLFNARSEKLARAMTFGIEDAGVLTCNSLGSLTPVSNKYSATYTIPTGGSCAVVNTDPGSPRYNRVTNTDQNHLSAQDYTVSSLYYIDAHIEPDTTLTPDDFPTEDANEYFTYFIAVGDTDTISGSCHVKSIRKDTNVDTTGSAVSFSFVDPDSVTRLSGTDDTESDGWTTPTKNLLATTPLGNNWFFNCSASFNSNSGSDSEQFTITVEGGGGNNAMPGDPIKVSCAPLNVHTGQTVRCLVAETLLDGTGRLANAAGTNIDIRHPDNTLLVSNVNPTEWQHGIYYYDFVPTQSGFYSVAVETTDVDTGNPIPGIFALYVQERYTTPTDLVALGDHFDERIDDIIMGNVTVYDAFGNLIYNDTQLLLNQTIEHRERSFEFNMEVTLILFAIAFFVVMAESRNDALYWFIATILSIYLLINRADDALIPIGVYVGWIFVCLYQSVSLLMTKRAQNLSNTEE